jgi:Holliday junction resolvase RusA-like endonuclease
MDTPETRQWRVDGVPVAQPRQRVTTIAGRPHNYTPTKHPVQTWKAAVAMGHSERWNGAPLEGPLRLEVRFALPRPQRLLARKWRDLMVWHSCKPDCDNLLKATKDALTGLAWRDDSQVCQCYTEKRYANTNEPPHAVISVMRVAAEAKGGDDE